jgi:hypothetical protein
MLVQPNRRGSAGAPAARSWLRDPGNIALAIVVAGWAVILAMILAHRVFVTNDSLSNYIHVWYVADRFWHGHGVPLHMPVIGHGDAYAFPYGFIPWMSAALLRPLLGDWVVTLWLVVGFGGVVAAQWWAFPELRGGWWTAMLLVNPMLVEGPILGQLPFLWAVAMFFAAIALWRGERPVAAAIMLGLSQATHPAVMLPIVGPLVLARLWWEPHRARLLAAYAASLVIAAPAVMLVLVTPSVSDVSTATLAGNFFGTVSLRAIVAGAPFIGLAAQRTPLARIPAIALVVLIAVNVILVPVRKNQYGWEALVRTPDTSLAVFIDSPDFRAGPEETYRILRVDDGKVGMYQLVKAGAYLDSEPFPESISRRSWGDRADYAAFLDKRHVRNVIIYDAYDERYRTNEHDLLRSMVAGGCGSLTAGGGGYAVFAVRPDQCPRRRADVLRPAPDLVHAR